MTDWDERFMRLAIEARNWVKGPDTGVGAIVVSPDRRRFSMGYSGYPRNVYDDRAFKDDLIMVHAELNAILNAGCSVEGWTLYSTKCPCSHCAVAAIQAGISRVVSLWPPEDGSRWFESQLAGQRVLMEAGVLVE